MDETLLDTAALLGGGLGAPGLWPGCLCWFTLPCCTYASNFARGAVSCSPRSRHSPRLRHAFRTDAKCADGYVVLGGWDLTHGSETRGAPWFSLRLEPSDTPWLFKEDGSSQWASTAAEFLGTMAALKAFGWLEAGSQMREWTTLIYAGTDNRANPQAIRKGGSGVLASHGLDDADVRLTDRYRGEASLRVAASGGKPGGR